MSATHAPATHLSRGCKPTTWAATSPEVRADAQALKRAAQAA